MAVGAGIINIDTQAIHMVKSQAQPRAAVPHEHGNLQLSPCALAGFSRSQVKTGASARYQLFPKGT
jgi:hypothetical protein